VQVNFPIAFTMIHLSPAAIGEVNRRRSKFSPAPMLFRVSVQRGGCADLYYILDLVEAASPEDRVLDCDGVPVVVDAQSWPYLDGLTLDYSEDLMGGGFRFHNPNASSSCGCGNSFSITAPSITAPAQPN
jgi:iron-sulfur cluster assembly accessory protein